MLVWRNSVAFSVGDVVCVATADPLRQGHMARVEAVLPKRHSVQDFQEYVVEFPQEDAQRFRYCIYREFELEEKKN